MRAFEGFIIFVLLAVGAAAFLPGIDWGLPSHGSDGYLFGNHRVWTGAEILRLAGPTEDASRGADVASHQAVARTGPIVVNGDDADRARIVRRYRLMSYQPDEWNTLKSLSEMKPGRRNFDPKLYQYGGLWIYPVGAMLKAAALLHLIELRSDQSWYLDHPDAFGRLYVVARLWSAIWGMIGIVAVFAIVRRITGSWVLPFFAAVAFAVMPVVVNMAHEAKPHLAGAVLMLLAVLAAARYAERGNRSAWLMAGGLCGAALGMVLTTLPIFLVLPVMAMLRQSPWREKIRVATAAAFVGIGVYFLANPYVPFNFIFHRAVLESNLGNSKAMYHMDLTLAGVANAAYLVAAGTSPVLALAGTCGAVALAFRAVRLCGSRNESEIRRRTTGLLLAVPSLAIAVQCVLVATAKPGEFGRFMLLPDIFLLIEGFVAIGTRWRRESLPPQVSKGNLPRSIAALFVVIATGVSGISYLRAFLRDSGPLTSRMLQARRLTELNPAGTKPLSIWAEPAPYCLPSVDLFDGPIILLPKDAEPGEGISMADVSIRTVDSPVNRGNLYSIFLNTPISWADKPFDVQIKNRKWTRGQFREK